MHQNDDIFDWGNFARETELTGVRKHSSGLWQCITDDCDTVRSILAWLRTKRRDDTGVKYGGCLEARDELGDMDFGSEEFLFLNLMEAHEPYRAPEEYQPVPEPELTEAVGDITYGSPNDDRVVDAYDDCVRYLADAYRDIFERLMESFDYVITLLDHGEMLGENGMWAHEFGLDPELTHVPLVISGTGTDETRTEPVSIVDIHRTVLELAGLDGDRRGQHLLGELELGDRLTEQHGLRSRTKEVLRESGYGEAGERYDDLLRGFASNSEYFYETVDGKESQFGSDPDGVESRLEGLVEELDVRPVSEGHTRGVPDGVEDRLEKLGYV